MNETPLANKAGDDQTQNTLLPCPFCGNPPRVRNGLLDCPTCEYPFIGKPGVLLSAMIEKWQQRARDETDSAPYWLCYAMADDNRIKEQSCDLSGDDCQYSGDCITEWCVPCAAKAWLREQQQDSSVPERGGEHAARVSSENPAPPSSTELEGPEQSEEI